MKLWILEDNSSSHDYDCPVGHVVRAETERQAREFASAKEAPINAHRRPIWLDPAKSTCVELVVGGDAGVVFTDYRAG